MFTLLVGRALPAQAVWSLERTPLLDIPATAAGGSINFSYPAGAMRLAGGGILVADRQENTIRVFDAKGTLVRSVGRAGQGPGEFQMITWAGRCAGDTLLVWDMRRRQASAVDASGAVARHFAIPPAGDTAQTPMSLACSPRGEIAWISTPRPSRAAPPAAGSSIVLVTAAVYRLTSDGRVGQRFGDVPAGEVVLLTGPTGGRGSAPRPMGRAAALALTNDAAVISHADSAVLIMTTPDGAKRQVPLAVTPRAPTREEYETAVQATASMIPPQARQAMATQLAAVPMPDRIPPIAALHVDPEGLLWVQTTPPGARTTEFVIVNTAGRVEAQLSASLALTVHEIGREYVVASYTDASEEMHLGVFAIRARVRRR